MATKWSELRAKMSPERRARSEARSQEILKEMFAAGPRTVINLSARDAKTFAEALARPAAPNPKLRRLLQSKAPWGQLTYTYWKDGAWFVGQVREMPAAISQGHSLAELEDNLRDAVQMIRQEQPDGER
jgi:hypothetical protein